MLGKRADGGLTAVVIILIIIVFLGWLINIGGRECGSNKECKEDYYCGSDFACHKIPVIEKVTSPTVIQRDYSGLKGPALLLSLAIIIAAFILRTKRNKKERKTEDITPYLSEASTKVEPTKIKRTIRDISKTQILLAIIAGGIIVSLVLLFILIIL